MAKMETDKINTHGGAGRGQGRKSKGLAPKKALGVKVDSDTKTHLVSLSETSGHSQASIVQYAIKSVTHLPTSLD